MVGYNGDLVNRNCWIGNLLEWGLGLVMFWSVN